MKCPLRNRLRSRGDNKEIDVYVLGAYELLQKYHGIVIGIIKRLNILEHLRLEAELNYFQG